MLTKKLRKITKSPGNWQKNCQILENRAQNVPKTQKYENFHARTCQDSGKKPAMIINLIISYTFIIIMNGLICN